MGAPEEDDPAPPRAPFPLRFICWTLLKHLTNLKQPEGSHIFRLTQEKSIRLGCSESIIFLISARINVIITRLYNTFIGAVYAFERIMITLLTTFPSSRSMKLMLLINDKI